MHVSHLFVGVSRSVRRQVPTYADALLGAMYATVARAALSRMSGAAAGCSFSRALALTSVQLAGALPSAPLPPPSPALPPPRPARAVSLSAGLPHFAVGYMRCWGRDTFIALRGLFLLTGRYQVPLVYTTLCPVLIAIIKRILIRRNHDSYLKSIPDSFDIKES